MQRDVTIRPAGAGDAAELARLRWDFTLEDGAENPGELPPFREAFARFWRDGVGSGRWSVQVAEREGRLVGNVWLQRIPKVPRPGSHAAEYGYVTNVYVEPGDRNRGLGAALMAAAIGAAREEGLEFLIVWPSDASIRFYERLGFQGSREAMEHDLAPAPVPGAPG